MQNRPENGNKVQVAVAESETSGDRSRRRHDRVKGPFDGLRLGLLETPIRIYDLSLGGCLVHSMHEQREGSRVQMKIDLPEEGWITVNAESLYRRPGFGFAVRFIDMDAATQARLMRTVDRLKIEQGGSL